MRYLVLVLLAACSAASSSEVPYHFPTLAPMSCSTKACTADEPNAVESDGEMTKYSLRTRMSCGPKDCWPREVAPSYCTSEGCEVSVAALTPSDRGPGQYAKPCGGECPKSCSSVNMDSICTVKFAY